MANNKNSFKQAARNIEIETVQDNINLLQKYIQTTDENKQNQIKEKMHAMVQGLLKRGYTPEDLITRFKKVIKVDKHRPRNLSPFLLAKSDDLNYIDGDFDTFDIKLHRLAKNIENNADKIRNQFGVATINRTLLAKQFTQDWIRRLEQHPELVNKVKQAPESKKIPAYNELLNALTKDFCAEYDIPEKFINVKVVQNWAASDTKPNTTQNNTMGFAVDGFGLDLQKNISEQKKQEILNEFKKSPNTYPGVYKKKVIRINLDLINKTAQKTNDTPFITMMATFAHEMNHVLDSLKPREGALGPQIKAIDEKTYVNMDKSNQEYHKSATEQSSYEITKEMIQQLKNLGRI